MRLPYAQDWTLLSSAQGWLLDVGYVGTKGTKLPRFIESNPPTLCSTLPLSFTRPSPTLTTGLEFGRISAVQLP